MRTIVHLSDLHFGQIDARTLLPLARLIRSLKPDVVVVSGDLTQRARPRQFQEARAFLDALPSPQIVVPGNHDIPLYNVFRRFASPLNAFRTVISRDPEPFHVDSEIAVAGLNTARSLTWKSGRLNHQQLRLLLERFGELSDSVIKVVVTHHPFELPDKSRSSDLIGGAHEAMAVFARAGVDFLLSGHLHQTHTAHTAERYKIAGHSALSIHAGTATSTRHRGERNSFNVLYIDGATLALERFSWDEDAAEFTRANREMYARGQGGWTVK